MSAKSRLTTSKIAELQGRLVESNQKRDLRQFAVTHRTTNNNRHSVNAFQTHFSPYIQSMIFARARRFYLLLISIPGYIVVFNILSNIPPDRIAHWLVPYSFLPLQAALAWGNFWALTWLFMNTGRGVRATVLLCLLLAFQLQNVVFEWWILTAAVGIFTLFEVISLLRLKK